MNRLALILCVAGSLAAASSDQKWMHKNASGWTQAQAQQILSDSPWVKQATVDFGSEEDRPNIPLTLPTPAQAGLADPTHGATDGRWDGGVSKMPRGGVPSLPVTVRWDSAGPVREALLKTGDPGSRDTEKTIAAPEKYYIITVLGLARRQKQPMDDRERQHIRQGLVNSARLLPRNGRAIVPADARIDGTTGTIQIYFPKTQPLTTADKEVSFRTVFGSMRVVQKFRLKDMAYEGQPAL